MQRAINLVFKSGVSFSVFGSEDMQKLIVAAKVGMKDYSKEVINPSNVKKSVREYAGLKAEILKKKISGRLINLSADFATCGRRSFLGKKMKLINLRNIFKLELSLSHRS